MYTLPLFWQKFLWLKVGHEKSRGALGVKCYSKLFLSISVYNYMPGVHLMAPFRYLDVEYLFG